jgi:pyruvate,water dikinase
MTTARRFIRWFHEIGLADVPLVGGKNASLGEMYRELTSRGVKIPNGFVITAGGYWSVLRAPPSRIHLTRRFSK